MCILVKKKKNCLECVDAIDDDNNNASNLCFLLFFFLSTDKRNKGNYFNV